MIPFFETRNEHFSAASTENINFPLHQHAHLELYYQRVGSTEMVVHRGKIQLFPGDLAVIFPNQVHSYRTEEKDSRAILVICDLPLTGTFSRTLSECLPVSPLLSASRLHPDVGYAMEALLQEQFSGKNQEVHAPFVQLILARVLPLLTLRRIPGDFSLDLVGRIVRYLGEHYREEQSLVGLARYLGVSKYHLSHIFAEKMGTDFHGYLSSLRLEYACAQIVGSRKSITEIAGESGFESQRTFYRVFREKYGVTPLNYRKQHDRATAPEDTEN